MPKYDCRRCGVLLTDDFMRATGQNDYCNEHLPHGSAIPVGRAHPEHAQDMGRKTLRSGTLRADIIAALRKHGPLSDDDLERVLGRSHQSVSGARNGLVKDGYVRGTGQLIVNRYGNRAETWEAV